jgi:hypothetical protein
MMVQMRYLSLTLATKGRLVLSILFLLGLILTLSACKEKEEYPRPSNAFYINDYAMILDVATRDSIRREGERLYEISQDETDGGSQIVVATFEVESEADIANYDITEIYRQWGIGDDDMGLLILMFFERYEEDDIEYLRLLEPIQVEVGYRMEQYLSPTQLGQILDNTIYTDTYMDLDMATMHMFYEFISAIYIDAYGYESFNYDMDEYQVYLDSNPDVEVDDSIPMSIIFYLISPFSSWSEKLSILLPYLIFMILGGGGLFVAKNVGGGGSSGGMGIRRRR